MIDWLNDNSGSVQALAVCTLVIVTAAYAWFTRRMAREIREERLAQDRPDLLIDIASIEVPERRESKAEDNESQASPGPSVFPDLICRIHNAGRHVAKEVAVTVVHPNLEFDAPRKGFLLPDDTWEVRVMAFRDLQTELEPWGLTKWAAAQGESLPRRADAPDTGVVVYYRDIHNVDWATYLIFGVMWIKEVKTSKPIKHDVVLGDQRRIRPKYRRLPPITVWVEPSEEA